MTTAAARTPEPEQSPEFGSLEAGPIKRIHVNQHVIRRNAKTGGDEPATDIKTTQGSVRCHGVSIHGASVVRYCPEKPLSCGAKVWIETRSELSFIGATG